MSLLLLSMVVVVVTLLVSPLLSLSSIDGKCDPCCSGVNKLTRQNPSGAGCYLSRVVEEFRPSQAFGPNACSVIGATARNLGVNVTLVGSDGRDACSLEIADAYLAITNPDGGSYIRAFLSLGGVTEYCSGNSVDISRCKDATAVAGLLFKELGLDLLNLESLPVGASGLTPILDKYSQDVAVTVNQLEALRNFAAGTTNEQKLLEYYAAMNPNIEELGLLIAADEVNLAAVDIAADAVIPYGNYYTVSRTWSLKRPIYAVENSVMAVANSLCDADGDFRAIYLTKSLVQLAAYTCATS